MLAPMGRHGLWVSEVAGLTVGAVDLALRRKVYLTETTRQAIRQWLAVRGGIVNDGERAVFVALDKRTKGGGLTTRAIRYVVDGYLDHLGLKAEGISCHSLRHSAATWAEGRSKDRRFGGYAGAWQHGHYASVRADRRQDDREPRAVSGGTLVGLVTIWGRTQRPSFPLGAAVLFDDVLAAITYVCRSERRQQRGRVLS